MFRSGEEHREEVRSQHRRFFILSAWGNVNEYLNNADFKSWSTKNQPTKQKPINQSVIISQCYWHPCTFKGIRVGINNINPQPTSLRCFVSESRMGRGGPGALMHAPVVMYPLMPSCSLQSLCCHRAQLTGRTAHSGYEYQSMLFK